MILTYIFSNKRELIWIRIFLPYLLIRKNQELIDLKKKKKMTDLMLELRSIDDGL
jgi:hypothetical protein